jgi:6-pyruvoyltetrahydropterin/6-carboxytetrahydropterin synthase
MYELTVITRFAAAHQLKMVSSKCENLHGHNWKVEVRISGAKLDPAGVLVDFGVIKKHVAEIISRLDHHYLNELSCFQKDQPSSENIARFIAEELQRKLDDPALNVSRVSAWESDDAGATYILPPGAHP